MLSRLAVWGRLRRSRFNLLALSLTTGYLLLGAALGLWTAAFSVLFFAGAFYVLAAPRYQDQGQAPRRLLLLLIPIFGLLFVLGELALRPGRSGSNEFGADPRETDTLQKLEGGQRMLAIGAYTLTVGALVLTSLLCAFTWSARWRESQTRSNAAPKTGRFVKAANVEVFISEAGPQDGPAIVLIHGTGAWGEIWRGTMTFLADKGCRVIAIDVPPFGYSGKPVGPEAYSRDKQARRIIGVLDALEIDKAIVMAHSVGARPAMEAILLAPERHSHFVLVDPALGFAPMTEGQAARFARDEPALLLKAIFALGPIRNSLLAGFGTNPMFTRKMFESFVSLESAVTDERVKTLQKPLSVENSTRSYGDWFENILILEDPSLSTDFEKYASLNLPVLLVWGRLDDITPLWQGEELNKLIPGSKLEVIDKVGHIPYLEDSERFHEVLWGFLGPQLKKSK